MNITDQTQNLPLTKYRVLELGDQKGSYCGRLLADFGADVIRIERPGGDPERNLGPFHQNIPHPEKSLRWLWNNANKRGITLNIGVRDGQEIFTRLAAKTDLLIESFPPLYLNSLGLGYEALRKVNPKIIVVSITPFGGTGPYRDYQACDLVYSAMSGFMYSTGEPGLAPLRISAEQAYFQCGCQAAVAALLGLRMREKTGEGQQIDFSIYESVVSGCQIPSFYWLGAKQIYRREGNRGYRGGVIGIRGLWPCKDGHVIWRILMSQLGRNTKAVVEWMNSEGMGSSLTDVDWESRGWDSVTREEMQGWENIFADFFSRHTKVELYEEGIKRGFVLFPVNTIKDVTENDQLKARQFWTRIEHHEIGGFLTYPNQYLKSTAYHVGVRSRAPLIGEHNSQIYQVELGISQDQLIMLKGAGII